MSKKRLSFVTNSSSSSYTCLINGETESGWDLGLEDAGMYECEYGHIFCENYVLGDPTKLSKEDIIRYFESEVKKWENRLLQHPKDKDYLKWRDDAQKELNNLKIVPKDEEEELISTLISQEELDSRYEIPAQFCPICQMNYIIDDHVLKYSLKYGIEPGTSLEVVCNQIRDKYNNYDEMKNDLE